MDLTLTSKGQATIPKEVREHLGVKPGDKVKCVTLADGRVYLLPKVPAAALKGMFKGRVTKPVTVGQMNAAIRKKAAALDKSSRRK
jgi:AbrB family looped-hinge helix DNA binding protein